MSQKEISGQVVAPGKVDGVNKSVKPVVVGPKRPQESTRACGTQACKSPDGAKRRRGRKPSKPKPGLCQLWRGGPTLSINACL